MFAAALDTSVLWPSLQRGFLLPLAVEGLYRPVWSSAILAELEFHEASELERRGVGQAEAQQRSARLIQHMRTGFADAEATGWEPLEGSFDLPDPDDEHVAAAVVIAGAGAIVTLNLKDFPLPRSCPPCRCSTRATSPSTRSPWTPTAHCEPSRPSLLVPDAAGRHGP